MTIHSFPEAYQFIRPVVTVGTFDGVHLGHREVISRLLQIATDVKGESVVVTLWPHPRIVLEKTEPDFFLLNTIEERKDLLSNTGIDHLVILPFTKEFSNLSSAEFIKNILVDSIGVKHLLVGENNHYGKNRDGDFQVISQSSQKYGFQVHKPNMITREGSKISSTLIRKILSSGRISMASALLGYDYVLSGEVIQGDQIGQKIGYPTANIKLSEPFKLLPPDGVYAVIATINEKKHCGMLYIGERPTLKKFDKRKNIEVHLINFAADLYNQKIKIHFIERIRGDMNFENLEALTKQIDKDKTQIIEILKKQL